jgi:hypothetical protein
MRGLSIGLMILGCLLVATVIGAMIERWLT